MNRLARTPKIRSGVASSANTTTKRLLYLYGFLLVFEGALRKWVLPGFSTPLILIRDPLAVLIIIRYAIMGGALINGYTLATLFVGILSFFASLSFGHGDYTIGLYGLRTLLLHFFLAFILGNVFKLEDVEKFGKILFVIVIPSTVLIALQFYSPQTAWVNRGVGGDLAGSGFGGAMGYFRPSGLFSFTNGNVLLFGLAAAFAGYFWNKRNRCNPLLLVMASVCVLVALPLCLSRTYFLEVALTAVCMVVVSLIGSRSLRPLLSISLILLTAGFFLPQFAFFQTAVEVMSTRFVEASNSEGGFDESFNNRVFGSIFSAVSGEGTASIPFWGYGLGLGTNIGAVLSSGERTFLVAEEELSRIVGEMGLLLGLPVLLSRVTLGFSLGFKAVTELFKRNSLPLMMLSFSFPLIIIGGWAQPTALGFFTLATGFTIASLKYD
jgi:uncharacterized membrane protein (UPF0136 family)